MQVAMATHVVDVDPNNFSTTTTTTKHRRMMNMKTLSTSSSSSPPPPSSSSSPSSSPSSPSSSSSWSSPSTSTARWLVSSSHFSSPKFQLRTPNTRITIIFVLFFILMRGVSCLDNVCQVQTSVDTTAFYVCMVDPQNLLFPNETNYKLTLDPVDSTCGITPQQYCTMTTPLRCDNCSSSQNHPKEYMVDYIGIKPNYNTSWQSMTWYAFGSRPQVTITISMGRRYILQDDIMFTFANPRPKQAVLEKSLDNGTTWTAWQYYNTSCPNDYTLTSPDQVVCTSKYSVEYPNIGGNLLFEINADRFKTYLGPNLNNFDNLYTAYETTNILDFLAFSDLRLRLIYPATDGQEISGKETDKLKYYYSISDIYLLAGCDCNRHAKYCNMVNGQMICNCEHNTDGASCERCLPLYNNRLWSRGSFLPLPNGQGNECQACNCYNRATACVYDPTINSGRCLTCNNNTQGVNCEACVTGFFRNYSTSVSDPNFCIICNCEPTGISNNGTCTETGGQCQCKGNVMGRRCNSCYDQLWGLLTNDTSRGTCKPCNCNTAWTVDNKNVCDQDTGQCYCVAGVFSIDCSLCADSFYRNSDVNYPKCDPCGCDAGGSINLTCDKSTGQCPCKPNLIGARCHFANPGFFIPLPDRINLKPIIDPGTTCQLRTGILTTSTPYTGRFYYACTEGQSAIFNNILGSFKRQGNIIQTYIPAIRYTLNDINPMAHASITFTPSGPNFNFSAIPYPNLTSTDCNASYPVVIFDLFSLSPGIGMAWMNMTGKIDLDVRCTYRAEFKLLSAGAATTPFLLDSLVLMPDLTQSLAYKMETSDANKQQYTACFQRLAPYNSNININQSALAQCADFFTSFMAEQTGEALACECSVDGSTNTNCTSLGGDCTCNLNVGGRRCDYCRAGFFGFSNAGCQACDCNTIGSSNPVCDYTTGQCPCLTNVAQVGQNSSDPSRVAGRQCGLCMANYYGINSGNGCLPCDCNAQGSQTLQCVDAGVCQCKPTIGGQRCDQCLPGYFGFSSDGCKQCNCSVYGSTNGSCGNDGQCFCKTNTQGLACNQCKDGTFGISATNPDGCQQCYCNGMSSTTAFCTPAFGFRQDIISAPDTTGWLTASDLLNYVLAPTQFLGNKRSSYGQTLNFTAIPMDTFPAGNVQYVILESTDGRRVYYLAANQSFTAFQPSRFSIQFHESKWLNDTGGNLTVTDFYKILSRLSKLMIQRTFLNQYTVNLNLISMVSAAQTNDPNISPVNYVENCTCTSNTAGFSCENCQQGFKRSSNDSSANCIPCTCQRLNPANQSCDEHTGQCLNCLSGSIGWNCEQLAPNVEEAAGGLQCKQGFWGISATGCQACSCSPIGSTDTTRCDTGTGKCTCKQNVGGLNCDRCEDGFVNLTDTGCSPCSQCYMLVADEMRTLLDMLTNQSDTFNLVNSTTTPDFQSRLVVAENNSTFLGAFITNFELNEPNYNTTLNNITDYYTYLDIFISLALSPARTGVEILSSNIKSDLDYADGLLSEGATEVLTVYNGFSAMNNMTNTLSNLNNSLTTINNNMRTSVFNVQYGFEILNNSVTNMEALAVTLTNNINNLTEITNTAVSNNQQLNNSITNIEQRVITLNSSSLDIQSQIMAVKKSGENLLNRTTIVYNMVVNLNITTPPDVQALSVNLAVNLPNRATAQQIQVNNLLNMTTDPTTQVQNVTQMTSALTARVTDFINQVNSMTARVVAANLTTSNAVNQSITTFTNAVNMFDVMSHFQEKSDALKSQATSAIQTANGFSTNSNNALVLANNITSSLDPILPLSDQALTISNNTNARCQALNIYPVRVRSDLLKSQSDLQLNDVAVTRSSVLTILSSTGNENVLALQRDSANQLANRVISLRNDVDTLSRNVSAVGQRLADIASQLSSKIPLPTDILRDLLVRCQDTKTRLNQLNQANTVQSLQTYSSTNQQWVSGLDAKKQELRTQLDRLKTVVGKLTKI